MTAEHLLDAMGLLDDELIQEAEGYPTSKRKRNYGAWLAWAASFTVVLVLGYGLTHLGMGGGAAPGANGGTAGGNNQSVTNSAPAPSGGAETNDSCGGGDGGPDGEGLPAPEPGDPCAPVEVEKLAVLIDGGLYRSTGEVVRLSPDEGEVQYGLCWYDEESGQSRTEPAHRWLPLEDGTVGVSWDVPNKGWLIFAPTVEP